MKKRCLLEIPIKDTLNSNSMPRETFVKSSMAKNIRSLGRTWGIQHHDNPELAQMYMSYVLRKRDIQNLKSRATKDAKKGKISSEERQNILVHLADEEASIQEKMPLCEPIFQYFTIKVHVCHPQRRSLDPPNLYPTIKPFIDGLTDAMWWEDDDFAHMLSTEFVYGGLSGSQNMLLVIDIEESSPENYITDYQNLREEYTHG